MQGQLRVEHTAVRALAGPCRLGVALLRETEQQVGPALCLYCWASRAVRDPAGRSQGPWTGIFFASTSFQEKLA